MDLLLVLWRDQRRTKRMGVEDVWDNGIQCSGGLK